MNNMIHKTSFLIIMLFQMIAFGQPEVPRYVVISDMTHDDGNSLIRLLLYSNEIEIAAIVVAPQLPDASWNSEKPWQKMQNILDAYEASYEQLKKHDPSYPTPEYLRSVTKRGHGALPIVWRTQGQKVNDWIGDGNTPHDQKKDSEASDFLVSLMETPSDRPLFVGIWGAPIVFSQTLYRLDSRNSDEAMHRIMDNVYIYSIHAQDISMDYFLDLAVLLKGESKFKNVNWTPFQGERLKSPPKKTIVDLFQFWSYIGFSKKITDQVHGHGPLSELYDHGGEGDTPAFLWLLSANLGLNDPRFPEQGSWGGRFKHTARPELPEIYTSNGVPGTELTRWETETRNSFMARLDRLVKEPEQVNHEPNVLINGQIVNHILRQTVEPGQAVTFDASRSTDPDGNKLSFKWWIYKDAGTYKSNIKITKTDSPKTQIEIPEDFGTSEAHVILEVRDNGAPNLTRYGRIILLGSNLNNISNQD